MQIRINGKIVEIAENSSIYNLLELKKLSTNIIVELNNNIIKKEYFSSTFLKDGDKVEILQFVGGG